MGEKIRPSIADAYDEWHRQRLVSGETLPTAPWHVLAASHVGDVADRAVLEIGCGGGEFAQLLAERGARVVAADCSPFVVAHVAERLARFPHARAVCADICDLPFQDQSFDLTVSLETIEHSPDPKKAIAELVRVTKDSGRLLVTSPNYASPIGVYRALLLVAGREFSEAGQPVNHWTTLIGNARQLRRLGCTIQSIDGAVHLVPVPFWREVDASWLLGRPHRVTKWIARHGLVAARRTH